MSVAAIGAVDYTKALDGLSLKQAQLMLTTQGIVGEEQKDLLVKQGLIATSDRMSASIVSEALASTALNKEQQEAILIKAGLMNQETKELITGNACTEAKLRAILAEKGIKGAKADTLIASILQTGQNSKEALSWKVLGASAKEAMVAMLHNPLTWVIAGIASIGLLVKGYDAVIGKQEKLSRTKIEGLDEDISKLDEEIRSLEELQSKLEDAKGSRYELSQIQTELNDAIGETQGLLNGESKAWDVANAKLKANIELKKQQRKQAQQDKVNESKVLYDNNVIEIDWHTDKSGEKAREYAKALGVMETYTDGKTDWESYLKFIESDDYKNLSQEVKTALGDAMTFKTTYDTEWAEYLKEQAETALSVFDETISNYDGAGGQQFIKGLISDMAQDGASLSEISDVVTQVIENQDMQDAINKYWESLVNPDINSEEALQAVKKIFDDTVAKNPALKDFFDNFYNGIVAGGKAATDTSSDVNKMTVSLDQMKAASDGISSVASAFKKMNDDGYISIDTITSIKEAVGDSIDNWEDYERTLLTAKKGSAELNKSLSDITYAILENKIGTEGLANATEDQIAAVLRDNGVTNANAVAHEAASRAKAEQYIKSQNLSKATNIESVKLIENAKAAGIDENAYRSLLAEEILFNNNKLDSKSKCEEILKIASAAGVAKVTMSSLNEEIAAVAGKKIGSGSRKGYIESLGGTVITSKNREDGKTNKGSLYIVGGKEFESFEDAAYFANAKKEQELISSAFKPITIPSYSTGGSGGGGSDSKESNDTKDNFDDSYHSAVDAWLEENKKQIERFEKEREKLNRQFENALDSGNKEQAEILRSKLAENVQKQKDILHEQNEAHRITQNDLLQSLYQYVPEFKDKSWDEISQVDLYNVEEKLSKATNEASDDAKNQASLKLNQFKGIVDDLKAINDAIEENSNSWWELDNDQKDYWESLMDFQNELSNTWIDNQKAFQKLSEKEELDAYGRMINNNKSFQKQILKDTTLSEEAKLALIKKTNDEITEIEKNAYDLRKDLYGEATDFGSKYIDSQKTLLQAYYDVTNSIREEQHEITKELEASKTMYEYLNEDTRKLLFNQEDYNELSEELYYIQYKASKLQREYTRELENSTINTIEEITSNYEMQYETLMKSYEIAKADLEVAKKKAKLNNVLNERNVRMFVNGQWQWVANTQDVIDAQNELADAEYERKTAELEKRQTASINNLTKQQDELSTVVSMFEDGVIDLGTAIYDAESALRTIPSTMANIISEIQSFSLNKNDRYGSVTYDKDFDYSSVMSGLDKNSNEWKILNEKRNAKIAGEGLSYNKYASGTRKAAPGKALLGEEEPEILLSKLGLTPITQPTFKTMDGGEVVFNSEQLANLRTLWDIGNGFKPNFDYINKTVPQTIDNSNCNNVIINGLTVDNGSTDGKALINALRRYTANH